MASYPPPRQSQSRVRDEEATIGRSRTRDGSGTVYPSAHNSSSGLDYHQASGKDWHQAIREDRDAFKAFVHRFTGRGRWVPWSTSLVNIARSSILNFLIVLLPLAWAAHFAHWSPTAIFTLCFLAIIPLEKLFDWQGEQMSYYLGHDLGELLIITLNNGVEATLAIILLLRCELKILQSTVTGVVILHLLLVPGMAFLTGGARIWEQNLHPHTTQLNHSLLTIGVLGILLPTAFFAALDRGNNQVSTNPEDLVSDHMRGEFLQMSRGLAIILLLIYIGSRIYMHNPPGEGNALLVAHNAPQALKEKELELERGKPKTNVWACLILLAVTITVMAVTAVFLIESVEKVIEHSHIRQSWFGVILLPLASFAADGAVATIFFARYALRLFWGKPQPPAEIAKGRAIDLSIQFVLFWLPFLVLLGWWTDRPLHMLFDYYEVALLLGACFLVNYVTADAKTNWVEGLIMVSFYAMIALVTWWYPGSPTAHFLLRCHSVLDPNGEGGAEHEAAGAGEHGEGEAAAAAVRLAARAVHTLLK